MSALVDNIVVTCPTCWSPVELDVDCSAGDQIYFEDCQVCCSSMEITIRVDEEGNLLSAEARGDNE